MVSLSYDKKGISGDGRKVTGRVGNVWIFSCWLVKVCVRMWQVVPQASYFPVSVA